MAFPGIIWDICTCLLSLSVCTETVLCIRCSSSTQMAQMQLSHVLQYTCTGEPLINAEYELIWKCFTYVINKISY